MKKIVFFGLAVVCFIGAMMALKAMDDMQDERLCTLMERQNGFDGETVDVLWHWKQEGRPSERFLQLYGAKIRDLPGWRP